MRFSPAVLLAVLLCAPGVAAQGTLSTQGFGYPTGQLGARARAMGGGLAEVDPISALNPGALAGIGRSTVYFEYAPEWRRVSSPGGADESTVSRFPLVSANIAIGSRWVLGFSSSTLLDRSWETSNELLIGQPPDTATAVSTFRASGAMNDVRVAGAYRLASSLFVGAAVHALTGESRTERQLVVSDSANYIPALERRSFSYSGNAFSVGAVWRPVPGLNIGASARMGGTVDAESNDTTLSRADYPTRAGGSVEFTRIRGLSLAGRVGWVAWSNLQALSVTGAPVRDTWEYGLGLEGRGPTVFGVDLPFRAGYARRTLPYGPPDGSDVTESAIAAGLGIPVASGRGMIDFSVERLTRDSAGDVSERGWIVGLGLLLRL